MDTLLPPPIGAYLQAVNQRDIDAFLACFALNAVVTDEERSHHGLSAIRQWREWTHQQYQVTMTALDSTRQGPETVVHVQIAGTFDGSPIELHYRFTLENDKIEQLQIGD